MTLFLFFLIVLLLIIIYLLLQKLRQPVKPPPPPPTPPGELREPVEFTDRPYYKPNEDALLMLQPGFTLRQAIDYFAQVKELGPIEVVPYCQSCDVLLFSIKGLNDDKIRKIVNGQTELIPPSQPHTDPKAKQSGLLGPVLYGFNYRVQRPFKPLIAEGRRPVRLQQLPVRPSEAEPVLVAVLDTGLTDAIAQQYEPAVASHCMGTKGHVGYNMVAGDDNTTDDYSAEPGRPVGHGTPVTGMVLRTAAGRVTSKFSR